jgi:hypothetical protein
MANRTKRSLRAWIVIALLAAGLGACGGAPGTGNAGAGAGMSPPDRGSPAGQAAALAGATKSAKRGVAYGHHSTGDLTALAGGISWWYNWSSSPEPGAAAVYQSLNVEFVSMVWGGSVQADKVAALIPAGTRSLLGFNEPNFISQSNMPPSEAAARWPVLQQIATSNHLKLASPAVNYCDDCVSEGGTKFSDPVAYLDAFFAACRDCTIDYIAVHWYACDVSALKWYIGRFKKYNKPIWLTEFACGDRPHDQITLDVQKNYMQAAVDYLEHEPAVYRYAWFSGRHAAIPNVNLLGADGQLTELGRLYVNLPHNAAQVE